MTFEKYPHKTLRLSLVCHEFDYLEENVWEERICCISDSVKRIFVCTHQIDCPIVTLSLLYYRTVTVFVFWMEKSQVRNFSGQN